MVYFFPKWCMCFHCVFATIGINLKTVLVPHTKQSLSSSLCQQEHQWTCQCLQSYRGEADTVRRKCCLLVVKHTKMDSNINSGMWCFSLFFLFSQSVHSFESNTVAKLESRCQSKQYFLFFLRILFTLWPFQWCTVHF